MVRIETERENKIKFQEIKINIIMEIVICRHKCVSILYNTLHNSDGDGAIRSSV